MADRQPTPDAKSIAECIARFREARPHVHCITNSVAQSFTANVLLAAGATPSMTIAKSEITSFVAMADALLVNLGTMDAERKVSLEMAITTAIEQNKPWSLDPVFVQGSVERLELARVLLERNPTVVRCNAGEGKALFGGTFDRIIDGIAEIDNEACIVRTGQTDRVAYGECRANIANGHPLMDRVTAMGCALNAVMVGFCAVEPDTFLANISALTMYGIAGEIAGEAARGPGSFVPHFLDALANVDQVEILKRVRIS